MTPKFRGFRKDGKGWVEGYSLKKGNEHCIWDNDSLTMYVIVPESLGMSTTLPDKHGKEIFGAIGEKGGDVLTCYELKVAIVFEAGQFVGKHLNNDRMADLQNRNWLQFEIIGNQYESNG